MTKNRKLLIIGAIVLLAVLAAGATFAWLSSTANDAIHFVYTGTAQSVEIELAEPNWSSKTQFEGINLNVPPRGGDWGVVEAKSFTLGRAIKKDPTVKSTGDAPCYVGMRISAPASSTLSMNEVESVFDIDWPALGSKWSYVGKTADGTRYYCYNDQLNQDEETTPLFTNVIARDITAANQDAYNKISEANTQVKICVEAYSVQATGGTGSWSPLEALKAEFKSGVNSTTHWDESIINGLKK